MFVPYVAAESAIRLGFGEQSANDQSRPVEMPNEPDLNDLYRLSGPLVLSPEHMVDEASTYFDDELTTFEF